MGASGVSTDRATEFRCRLLDESVQRRIRYYPRIAEVAFHIKENIKDCVRLEGVASIAGMTSCAFSRYFADKVGLTFSEFVKTMRIEHAIEHLEQRDCAISKLAEEVGYRHGAFSRAFKD